LIRRRDSDRRRRSRMIGATVTTIIMRTAGSYSKR
jgi:hypothetical protein